MTEDPITRTRYAMGAEVPSWLMDAEPISTTSVRGRFTFMVSCDVIDLPDYYALIPIPYGPIPGVVTFSGAGCKILATSKPVRLVVGQQTLETAEIDAWSEPWGGIVAVPATQGNARGLSFWSRVKALFR